MPTLTFINHATVLLQLEGVNVLTDPIYSLTLSYYFPRLKRPGIRLEELPQIDIILISHADYDHLNLRTLRRLRRKNQSIIVFPRGLGKYGTRAGFSNVRELNNWESCVLNEVKITGVTAKHSNKRLPWDAQKTMTCGYVIEKNGASVYFAGDTGYGRHFAEIGKQFRLDVALLPIGAYKPHDWFKNVHLNPSTALKAFQELNCRFLVPIHWGTFKISDEPMREPPELLRKEADAQNAANQLRILENGESFTW